MEPREKKARREINTEKERKKERPNNTKEKK